MSAMEAGPSPAPVAPRAPSAVHTASTAEGWQSGWQSGWQGAEGRTVIGHQVRAYPAATRLARGEQSAWRQVAAATDTVTRPPELDADELAGLTLPGITEATQPTHTWGIL